RGRLLIDPGAVRAVREGSASLPPVGVVEVVGEFDAGDAVEIVGASDGDGASVRSVAKGICNYSASELRRVKGLKSAAVRQILALPDPVGEVLDGHRLPNGLDIRRVRVPLGVIAVVYEARPNVTIDAAALCLKSGNAIVLRGSSSAVHSNAMLVDIAAEAAT